MVSDTLATLLITTYLAGAGDHAALYQGQIEPAFVQSVWTTHPYWDDEEFHRGSICFGGNVYHDVPLRYNIMENRLSVITTDKKFVLLPDQQRIDWFEMDGQRFVRVAGGFMRLEYEGREAALLLSRTKSATRDVFTDRKVLKEMETVERYFLRLPDGTLHEVSNFRSLTKAVPTYRDELKQYRRQHDLDFWKVRRGRSLAQCTELIDGLLAAEDTVPVVGRYTLTAEAVPTLDSLLAQVDRVAQVPAYQAYTPGSVSVRQYADDEAVSATPGIAPMSPLREARTLQEVEVLGMHSKLEQQVAGIEVFRPALLRNVPLAMGEADVLKLTMTLPGVSSTGEASSGINVRGSATEHTQMLYNGNTIFNPMHLFGLFSAFDPDLVGETELYKGSLPSQYGGRLSSVLNVKGRTADPQAFHASASVGLVTSRAVVEVPIVRNRTSLIVGGRATYSDWMLKLMPKEEAEDDYYDGGPSIHRLGSYRDGQANYWDLGATLSTRLTAGHTLLVNGYYSRDRFSLSSEQHYAYGNMNFSAELRSRYGERLSTVVNAGYDHYDYLNDDSRLPYTAARLTFDLNQYYIKGVADYRLNDLHRLNVGLQGQQYDIVPGRYQPLGNESRIVDRTLTADRAVESALWVEDEWSLRPEFTLTGGVRLNLFASAKAGLQHTYVAPDLRLTANYKLGDEASVKASFGTSHQFIHKVSNTVIMSPTDTWMLSNAQIKPQSGWQLSTGYYCQPWGNDYELSAEAYLKAMDHYLTYRSGAVLVMNDQLERDVVGTQGRAYGLELQLRKLYGRLTGWLSYTYSRTQLRQRAAGPLAINQGRWFAADYDSPHDVKLVCNFKLTRRYSTSLNADYSTGRPFTAPVAIMPSETTGQYSVPVYSDRNALRMPDYFRVDWSFNVEPSHRLTTRTHSWFTLGIYNVLGRRNAYSVYFEGTRFGLSGYQLSIFGAPIPYINYNIKF